MYDSIPDEPHFVSKCPNCDACLEDAWDHGADACGVCGFAWVSVQDLSDESFAVDQSTDPALANAVYLPLALTGFALALLAGMMLSDGMPVATSAADGGVVLAPNWQLIKASMIGSFGAVLITAAASRGGSA